MSKNIFVAVGHGGRDPGAVRNGVQEKNVTLPTALFCEEYLKSNHTGFKILLSRRQDKFVSLNDQISMARNMGADAVVDVHYNSFGLASAHGMETFIAKTQITDSNIRLQRKIHDAVADAVSRYSIHDRGAKRSSHYVIRHLGNSNIDAVLVEGLFLSNPREAELIQREEVQKAIGYAIGKGLAEALNLPSKEQDGISWDNLEMPEISRPVGVELEGDRTEEIGFLAKDPVTNTWQTYLRAGFTGDLPEYNVTGHGDHIKIKLK